MKIFIYSLLLACTLVSCKKNDFNLDLSGIEPMVLVPNTNWPGQNLYGSQPQDSLFGVTRLNLYARVSYAVALDKPVKVTFKSDPGLLTAYNAKWGTAYQLLPTDAYNVVSPEVTIPAGVQQASVPITLNPQKISGTQDYFLAFTISSADGLGFAANAKSIIFTLKGQ
jgi:hypothetical protein